GARQLGDSPRVPEPRTPPLLRADRSAGNPGRVPRPSRDGLRSESRAPSTRTGAAAGRIAPCAVRALDAGGPAGRPRRPRWRRARGLTSVPRADMLGNPVAAQVNIDKTGKTERITEMLGLRQG